MNIKGQCNEKLSIESNVTSVLINLTGACACVCVCVCVCVGVGVWVWVCVYMCVLVYPSSGVISKGFSKVNCLRCIGELDQGCLNFLHLIFTN